MRLLKTCLFAVTTLLLAPPVVAQGWTDRTSFEERWFWGGAGMEGGPISFNCAGHYADADWSYGEGGGPYDPYIIHISMNETIGVANSAHTGNGATRDDVVFVIGGAGYQLPSVYWNEMVGDWGTIISIGDPLVTALLSGGDAQLWTGQVLVGDLPGAGLASSMASAINFCDDHWIASGAPLPSHAAETIQILRATPQPISMEQAVLNQITTHCGGAGEVRADAVGRSDFDGDGREDLLLHYSGVSCQQGQWAGIYGAGECDAQNCLTLAFVSGSIAAGELPYRVLASSARVDPNNSADILLGVDPAVCSALGIQPDCIARQRWNGTVFALVP